MTRKSKICCGVNLDLTKEKGLMNMNTDTEWLKKKAEQEDGGFVSVGGLVLTLEQTAQDRAAIAASVDRH